MDPQIQELLERARQGGRKPFWQCTAQEARTLPTLMKGLFGPAPEGVATRDLDICSTDGHRVPARLYLPQEQAAGLVVFFHGGGWVLGSVDDYEPFTARLAIDSGLAVLSVDYRLAPEHPYPAPVHDAIAALTFAAEKGHALIGSAPGKLVVMGDSAGATLATVAARHHRDRPGLRPVDLQVLAYPVTGAGFDTPSYAEFSEGFLLTARDMRWFWQHYCPSEELRAHPDATPNSAGELGGMGKVLVLTAECDPLRDEGEAYASRLALAGSACELVRCEGLVHGFLAMINLAPSARAVYGKITDAIRDA